MGSLGYRKTNVYGLVRKVRNGESFCLGNEVAAGKIVKQALEFDENGKRIRR